jgi:hypothetical protein
MRNDVIYVHDKTPLLALAGKAFIFSNIGNRLAAPSFFLFGWQGFFL